MLMERTSIIVTKYMHVYSLHKCFALSFTLFYGAHYEILLRFWRFVCCSTFNKANLFHQWHQWHCQGYLYQGAYSWCRLLVCTIYSFGHCIPKPFSHCIPESFNCCVPCKLTEPNVRTCHIARLHRLLVWLRWLWCSQTNTDLPGEHAAEWSCTSFANDGISLAKSVESSPWTRWVLGSGPCLSS